MLKGTIKTPDNLLTEEEKKILKEGPIDASKHGGCLNVFVVLLVLTSVLILL